MATSRKRSKPEYESLYQQAVSDKRLRADPISCLEDLQKALDMVLDGYVLERISPKGQLIEVTEKHPDVVPKIIKAKMDVIESLKALEGENVTCQLIVTGLDISKPSEMSLYDPTTNVNSQ